MSNVPAQQDWGVQNQDQPAPTFDFVGMLQRRFWIIILCLIFATGGGVFWYWKSEVKYASTARVAIAVNEAQVAIIGNDGLPVANQVTAHDQIIMSENVLGKAAATISFAIKNGWDPRVLNVKEDDADSGFSDTEDANDSKGTLASPVTRIAATTSLFQELQGLSEIQIRGHLKGSISISQDKKDKNIYLVSYTGSNRSDCPTILSIVINEYKKYLADKYRKDGDALLTNIKKAKTGIDKNITKFRNDYEVWQARSKEDADRYMLVKDGVFITDAGKVNNYRTEFQNLYREHQVAVKKVKELKEDQAWMDEAIASGKSDAEILAHINKFAEWMNLESSRNQQEKKLNLEKQMRLPFEPPTEPPTIIQTRFSVQAKQNEIDALIGKGFGENHPDVKQAKRLVANLESQLKILESIHAANVKSARSKYDMMQKQLDENDSIEPVELPEEVNPLDDINLIDLHRINLVEELKRVTKNESDLKLAYEKKRKDADIVDEHLAEEQKLLKQVEDQQQLNEIVLQKISEITLEKDHTTGGYEFDILDNASFARQTEPSLMKVFAISTFLGIAVGTGLSYLIEIADKTFRNPGEIAQQLGMRVIGHVPVLSTRKVEANDSSLDDALVTFHLPKSQQSEAFRAIRTSIFFNGKGKSSQILQVTSPTPGDGKSTLAANLAVSLAQSGKKVLICDADLRRPTVHYLFGNDSDIGFAQVLKGEAEIEDAIADCDVDGLSIMPCGARPTNPSELLTSTRLYELFEVLREKFDYIIMDTPPMLAVTDPCAVAARADGVILTMRIKKNIKLSASRAKEILDSVNAPILGIVVNGAGMVQGNYSNSGSYGYGYGGYGSGYGSGYSSSYYSYGYDYGESTYYYDEDNKPKAKSKV